MKRNKKLIVWAAIGSLALSYCMPQAVIASDAAGTQNTTGAGTGTDTTTNGTNGTNTGTGNDTGTGAGNGTGTDTGTGTGAGNGAGTGTNSNTGTGTMTNTPATGTGSGTTTQDTNGTGTGTTNNAGGSVAPLNMHNTDDKNSLMPNDTIRDLNDLNEKNMLMPGEQGPAGVDVYRVRIGDTLWEISQKYKVRIDAVIDANPQVEDPDEIYPNDMIKVPLEDKNKTDIGAAHTDDGSRKQNCNPAVPEGSNANVKPQSPSNPMEQEVLALVNKERAKVGAAPLKLATDVSNVARVKCEDMRNSNYFSHNSPKYGSPFDMLKSFNISYSTAGENIAKGQKTAASVMNAWMNSSGHKANILNSRFTEIGIGCVTDGGTPYWTQIFVTRK